MDTRNYMRIAVVATLALCSAAVTAQTELEPIPFTNHAALCQETLLYTADGLPYGSHWSWRFAPGPWAWLSDADDALPHWTISAFAKEEDLWGVGGSLSMTAHEPGDPSAVRGTLVLGIEALDHAMNFSADDAIVDEGAGLIMITFGYQNLPGPASTIITGTLEKTGVFKDIELVGEQNIYFNGHLFLRRIADMDLQDNINQIVQTEGPLGGFCTAVWDGHYLPQPAAEANEPTLIAHWSLDETEGSTAYDDAGDCNAVAIGGPVWRPGEGQIDGALELDGTDDFAVSDCVLNPADGPFSIFAWIKGGAPGQTIVSQQCGANWLATSDEAGMLQTELTSAEDQASVLTSEVVITDGNWHPIGFTWDGATRILYVDNVEVARDTQANLAGSTGNLLLGATDSFAPGSFWAGLIDDVRVYDRAMEP